MWACYRGFCNPNVVSRSGVDFNIEAADELGSETPHGFLEDGEHLGTTTGLVDRCETPPPESTSANEGEKAPSVNGGVSLFTPPSAKKKRPYTRKLLPKSESSPVVKLHKLSPNTIARHTNGEPKTDEEAAPGMPSAVEATVSPLAKPPISLPPTKKRALNGPGFIRSKQAVKKKAVKSKVGPRHALIKVRGGAELGITPLDSPDEEPKVECIKCSAVVGVSVARQHLSTCPGQLLSPVDIGSQGTTHSFFRTDLCTQIDHTLNCCFSHYLLQWLFHQVRLLQRCRLLHRHLRLR